MKREHLKSKKSKSFSILIIPESKNIKQLKILTWIPKFITTSLVIIILMVACFTWNLYTSYHNLKKEYQVKIQTLSQLQELNTEQKSEIDNLKQKTVEIQEKLDSISILEETVKNMVGLKSEKIESVSSRSGNNITRDVEIMSYHTNELSSQMDKLSNLLDESKTELDYLISDVEERLNYLDAKPNLMPTSGIITSKYGYRNNPFGSGREFHYGIDIANSYRTKIKAAGKGVVTYSSYNSGYGNYIIISHGYGYQSVYGHLQKRYVKVGQTVEKGQLIGEMGSTGRSTGTHLHFEIRYQGKPINPFNVLNNNK